MFIPWNFFLLGVNNTPLYTCGPHLLIRFQFGVYESVISLVKFFPVEIVSLYSPLDRLLLAYRVQLTFFLCGFFCPVTSLNSTIPNNLWSSL